MNQTCEQIKVCYTVIEIHTCYDFDLYQGNGICFDV